MANILTPPQHCSGRDGQQGIAIEHIWRDSRFVALLLSLILCTAAIAPLASAQSQPPEASAKQPAASTSNSGQKSATAKKAPPKKATSPAATQSAVSSQKLEQQLSSLAHTLDDKSTPVNEQKLAAFAQQHAKDEYGSMAALALGHHHLDKGHPAEAIRWLDIAVHLHSRVDEYAMFWNAQALRQLGRNAEAIKELGTFRKKYPESVMSDLAVQAFAEALLAQGESQRAAAELDAFSKTSQKPVLLLLRAQAREKSGSAIAAAKDYLAIYYGYPLSDESRTAGTRIPQLSRQLGASFPATEVAPQVARAEALYEAHHWRESIQEFEAVLPQTSGADHAHAELRIAQCRSSEGGGASPLAAVNFTDADAEAERLYSLSQAYRNEKREPEMMDAVNQVLTRFPQNTWAGETLISTGNYYWVALDRAKGADFYRRAVDKFPENKNAPISAWRAAWAEYLDRKPEEVATLEAFIQKFPTTNMVPDALYWLGRAAERDGNVPHARSYYVKAAQRFPQAFFGMRSSERLAEIGTEPLNPAEIVSAIPDAPAPGQIDAPVPPEAQERWQRANALRAIGFDASAELELRAAFAATQSPRLLLEAAQAAIGADHYGEAITLARQAYPQPESHRVADLPPAVAHVLYPLPYFPSVERSSGKNKVDPMLVTGIMRQESAFQSDAVSRAGAVGLMQVLPKTAPQLARRLRVSYTRARLFDPDYNLQLGTLYLSDLLGQFGSPEAALAAYNAGEDRVKLWEAERNYSDPLEFAESIPFAETRDYVQIVMRNAAIYRILNPPAPPAANPPARKAASTKSTPAHSAPAKQKSTRGEQ
ncbi:MAG: transglycosylase SLT domain-containing protein [Candidatus Acidiferrales bacterium]